ncbi:hypothetical protein [Dysgonomonas sp.]
MYKFAKEDIAGADASAYKKGKTFGRGSQGYSKQYRRYILVIKQGGIKATGTQSLHISFLLDFGFSSGRAS